MIRPSQPIPLENDNNPRVLPILHYNDNDSDDGEVLNELSEYENAGILRRERIINSFDVDDLAFQCMIGFRKFTAYLYPFLPMNIISRKAYNTIMVEGLEGTGRNWSRSLKSLKRTHSGCLVQYLCSGTLIGVRKFLIKNEEEIFTVLGDGVGIKTQRRRIYSNVIFDKKKLGSS
ncbi:hypothetical protein Tco_0914402 [Tanacetum coccineum]